MTPVKVYVAGASNNRERARAFMARVRAHPRLELTFDWVANVDARTVPESELNDEDRALHAWKDLEGVDQADVLVVLAGDRSIGMWVELGYAIRIREYPGTRPYMILVSKGNKQTIFTSAHEDEYGEDWGPVDAELQTDDLTFEYLVRSIPSEQ